MTRALLAAALVAAALGRCGLPAWLSPKQAEPASLVEWVWSGAVTRTAPSSRRRSRPGAASASPRPPRTSRPPSPRRRSAPIPTRATSSRFTSPACVRRPSTTTPSPPATRSTSRAAAASRTFPSGPASFTVAFGSCASTGSDSGVWDEIRELDPLLFLHLGDFHYEDLAADDPSVYRLAYARALTAPRQAHLYRSLPIAYVWDDHDFGGNNSDRTSRGRRAVRRVYQEIVPHYPLAAGGGDVPIYQTFHAGRLRFVVTDLRSERSPRGAADTAGKTAMGAAQKAWWKRELLAARDAGELVAWVSTNAWIGGADRRNDGWGAYSTERRELAEFLVRERIDDLFVLSGDAHMLAIDDGSHSGYANGGGPGFPVVHAAALDRRGSVKGGPYSEGVPQPHRPARLRRAVDADDGARHRRPQGVRRLERPPRRTTAVRSPDGALGEVLRPAAAGPSAAGRPAASAVAQRAAGGVSAAVARSAPRTESARLGMRSSASAKRAAASAGRPRSRSPAEQLGGRLDRLRRPHRRRRLGLQHRGLGEERQALLDLPLPHAEHAGDLLGRDAQRPVAVARAGPRPAPPARSRSSPPRRDPPPAPRRGRAPGGRRRAGRCRRRRARRAGHPPPRALARRPSPPPSAPPAPRRLRRAAAPPSSAARSPSAASGPPRRRHGRSPASRAPPRPAPSELRVAARRGCGSRACRAPGRAARPRRRRRPRPPGSRRWPPPSAELDEDVRRTVEGVVGAGATRA